MSLTIFGGKGFVLGKYVDTYYHHAIGNIASINAREDYEVYSEDVLYGASTVHNYHVYDNPNLDIDTNLTMLVKVLENWKSYQERKKNKGCFNFLSSWSVYGNQTTLPVAETAACFPKGFYIATKFCAENLLEAYCVAHGLKYRILRLANIIGPGDSKVSEKKNTLQNSFNKLRRNEDIELFGDGVFFRDFMHVDDCVEAIETVMARGEENTIYNIGNGSTNGRPMYYRDILAYAKDLLKSTSTITFKPPTAFQASVPVSSFYMDVNKLRVLGFTPKFLGKELFKKVIIEG